MIYVCVSRICVSVSRICVDVSIICVCSWLLTSPSSFFSSFFCRPYIGELDEGSHGPAEQQDPAVSRVRRPRKAAAGARVYVREGTADGPQRVSGPVVFSRFDSRWTSACASSSSLFSTSFLRNNGSVVVHTKSFMTSSFREFSNRALPVARMV